MVGALLIPIIVCHKPCEKLGKSTQGTLAIENASTGISIFDSDTVPFASSASGAAKGATEQIGTSMLRHDWACSCSLFQPECKAVEYRFFVRSLVEGCSLPLQPLRAKLSVPFQEEMYSGAF